MNISKVGGAEQYVYNKLKFLEREGYTVYIFSSLNREIIIEEFKRFENLIIPSLMYSPSLFWKSEVKKTINKICTLASITDEDTIKIETHSLCGALWGELLAKKLCAQNLVYNLQEIHNYSEQERAFLEYKLNKNELAGITNLSVEQMLGKKVNVTDNMVINAYCNNVVDDCIDSISEMLWKDANYSFASIGRLEKEFVQPMIDSLVDYVRTNSSYRFNIVFIGGSNKKGIDQAIRDRFKKLHNVNLIITGYVYPIPRSLIKKMDLFISTSGSASVSYFEHVPTIKVHPVTAMPTQIMGYTYEDVESHTMYDEMKNTTLLEQIEIVLSGIDIIYPPLDYSYITAMNNEFNRELAMFSDTYDQQYYDANMVKSNASLKHACYYIIAHLCGGRAMQAILEFARKLKKY